MIDAVCFLLKVSRIYEFVFYEDSVSTHSERILVIYLLNAAVCSPSLLFPLTLTFFPTPMSNFPSLMDGCMSWPNSTCLPGLRAGTRPWVSCTSCLTAGAHCHEPQMTVVQTGTKAKSKELSPPHYLCHKAVLHTHIVLNWLY